MFIFYLKQIYKNKVGIGTIKYFNRWKNSLADDATSVRDEQPWITFPVIVILNRVLTKNSKVFEYGGGGSTLFLSKRAKEVYTVEHNPEWFDLLKSILEKKAVKNWKGFFVKADNGNIVNNADKSVPDHYSSGDKESAGKNYEAYVKTIDQFPDGSFDLVMVDGRSRPSCIKHAIPKIKKGGYLLLDNSERAYYLTHFTEIFKNEFKIIDDRFAPSPYSKYFTKTTLWIKK